MDEETLTFIQNADSPLAVELRNKYKIEKGEDIDSIKSKTSNSPVTRISYNHNTITVEYEYEKITDFSISGTYRETFTQTQDFDSEEIAEDSEIDLIDKIHDAIDISSYLNFSSIEWDNFDQNSFEVDDVAIDEIELTNWDFIQEELEGYDDED